LSYLYTDIKIYGGIAWAILFKKETVKSWLYRRTNRTDKYG